MCGGASGTRADKGLVTVDATSQGNSAVRGGPLPAAGPDGWSVHVYVDHSIIEVIVNKATAFVVYTWVTPTSVLLVRASCLLLPRCTRCHGGLGAAETAVAQPSE